MTWGKDFFRSKGFIRFITLLIVVVLLLSIKSMLNLVLFSFIFSFLMGRLQDFISFHLKKIIPANSNLIIILLYSIVVVALIVVIYKYIPVVIAQISTLVKQIIHFYDHPPDNPTIVYLLDLAKKFASPQDLEKHFNMIYSYVTNFGKVSLQVLLAIILSLFFLLEKKRIVKFSSSFKYGKFGGFFLEIEYFGKKFINTFGKVIEVQFTIAFVNALLSTIALWILGFPQLIGLAIMIFFLGLIPVAGVFISLVPLVTIAYSIGGGMQVIYVLIMITALHALEAYVLNPKFMSAKTNLPAFYTFLVLIFSEHFLGIWGLIIGIPIFIFVLDILGVKDHES
ncbi:AI-2E family transporter [Peribacillus deserti]|uniref:AI-2E family transporter n=1 Tax=Peribacillus deserti TaxID=673318 RepID=A0A2N5MB03_9BACI|nr:AI-2E family transporter [Peribacillus deserti]PLT31540.1 AI-2E family transporter [Peribacillus deserti]